MNLTTLAAPRTASAPVLRVAKRLPGQLLWTVPNHSPTCSGCPGCNVEYAQVVEMTAEERCKWNVRRSMAMFAFHDYRAQAKSPMTWGEFWARFYPTNPYGAVPVAVAAPRPMPTTFDFGEAPNGYAAALAAKEKR